MLVKSMLQHCLLRATQFVIIDSYIFNALTKTQASALVKKPSPCITIGSFVKRKQSVPRIFPLRLFDLDQIASECKGKITFSWICQGHK